ncbi:putative Chymotrypsinogen B [Hypsibius exemplaris]|uniref:Chymotrypsinogen B n=1 Tax=Hypsibius exemplaris TaxID=2072580 RepID=A0A1W0WEW2_HYPEX|nr:putative Chymotrypsinogen B [Hypsibius exemplaris]
MFGYILLLVLIGLVRCQDVCPGGEAIVITGTEASFFESPNYPEEYANSVKCSYNITTAEGEILEFTAETFHTEARYDTLTFTDTTAQPNVLLETFSGTVGPVKLKSTGHKVRVDFVSDSSATFTGFRIRVQKPKCPKGVGQCPYAVEEICFTSEQLCDGTIDCPGGTDEFCPSGCGIPPKKPTLTTKSGERIVGGVEATRHTWPWQVSMQTARTGQHRCGGSIIDHHWVISAAHCCESGVASDYQLRVGEHDIVGGAEPNAWSYNVELMIRHPRHRLDGRSSNDICLFKTKQPIFFNDDVYPICLASGPVPPVGTDCFITGWGSTIQDPWTRVRTNGHDEGLNTNDTKRPAKAERASEPLQQVDLRIMDQTLCRDIYARQTPPAFVSKDMICATNEGKDSCQGDSGGPFVCPSQSDPNTWELVGVVSWGYGCASVGIPGVYARTNHFLDWIAETIYSNSP